MTRTSRLNARSSERNSRSELRSSDSYSDRDVRTTKSRYQGLKSSIDSKGSATAHSVRLVGTDVDYTAPGTCVAREINPSISLRSMCAPPYLRPYSGGYFSLMSTQDCLHRAAAQLLTIPRQRLKTPRASRTHQTRSP